MRRFLVLALILVMIPVVIGHAQVGTRDNPIKMVLVSSTHGEDALHIAEQIAEALYDWTSYYIEPILQPDYAELVEAFAASDGDVFGILPSFQYLSVYDQTNGNVTPRLVAVRYGLTYDLAGLYARRDSGIDSIFDCSCKVWLATDELSASGNVIPNLVFENWGIVPSDRIFTGSHGSAIGALVEGQGDFATCYYSPPGTPEGWIGPSWTLGDDLERWLWDDDSNSIYPESVRGSLNDARGFIADIYAVETLIEDLECVALIGGVIPHDCVAFGPCFDSAMADAIVDAIEAHIATAEGQKLWGSNEFGKWTEVAQIDDSCYDELRAGLGVPIPTEHDSSSSLLSSSGASSASPASSAGTPCCRIAGTYLAHDFTQALSYGCGNAPYMLDFRVENMTCSDIYHVTVKLSDMSGLPPGRYTLSKWESPYGWTCHEVGPKEEESRSCHDLRGITKMPVVELQFSTEDAPIT